MTAGDATTTTDLPDLLRRPREEVRALQDRLLRETVELCYRGHPFYRERMRRAGLEPRHLTSCDDLARLPVTTKDDFLADPEAFRLRGEDLPAEALTLWKVIYTTGTTSGRPAPIYVTTHDHYLYMEGAARRKPFVDIHDTDVVANLFPLTPFPMGAYSRAADEVAACGAGIVFAHTGRPVPPFTLHNSLDDAVGMVERHRATVLWGIASFVRRLLVRAAELGADLRAVRMAMITGEVASPALRDDLRRRMGELGCAGTRIVNRYGSTEQGSSMVECQDGSGFHSLAPDQLFHEVVDPDTGTRLPDGHEGMLAFTHLSRRGTVFLRYLVGDAVTMATDPCPHCGATMPRISSRVARVGGILKIRGTLVNVRAITEFLERLPEVDEYQLVVRPEDERDALSMDELAIRIAPAPGAGDRVTGLVTQHVLDTSRVRPRVELAAKEDIYDVGASAKPRRLVDLREAAG